MLIMTNKYREYGNIESSFKFFKISKFSKDSKILDIGCNLGSLINLIYEDGYKRVYGLDIRSEAINKGKQLYPQLASNLKDYNGNVIPHKANSFDVVLMFDVIEHIPNLERFLEQEVYRVLKKDGIFMFQTPNKYSNIVWEMISSRSLTKWRKYHPSLQTPRSLRNLLESKGFKEIRIGKGQVLTEYNKEKVRRKVPIIGIPILFLLSKMPLYLSSNIWGKARK